MHVEASIQVPQGGPGLWAALWLQPAEDKYGGWPMSGEVSNAGAWAAMENSMLTWALGCPGAALLHRPQMSATCLSLAAPRLLLSRPPLLLMPPLQIDIMELIDGMTNSTCGLHYGNQCACMPAGVRCALLGTLSVNTPALIAVAWLP